MSQAELIEHPEPDARMRKFNVDRTPYDVAVQGCSFARYRLGDTVDMSQFLDPCAGDGVFVRAVQRLYPRVRCTAVEVRREERACLKALSAEVHTMPFQDYARREIGRSFDFIGTNPPFDQWAEIARAAMLLLAPRGVLCLYGLSTWGHSDEASEAATFFEEYPPTYQARVMGRVRHRFGNNPKTGRKYGTDSRKYSFWLWRKGEPRSESWRTCNLPRLTNEQRTWRPA